MIVSHRHRFIFVRNPKTASTSVALALSAVCGERDVIAPVGQDEALRAEAGGRGPQNQVTPFHTWAGARQYGVRDWARLLLRFRRPRYFNHMGAPAIRRAVGRRIWDDYFTFCFERNPFDKVISYYFWKRREPDGPRSLSEFVQSGAAGAMSTMHLYSIDGRVAVDRVCRFENLEDELARLSDELGLGELPKLLRAKSQFRTDPRHYRELLSDADRRWIERHFAREIAEFGYAF